LWYTPDLSMFARVISATYDAIEDRGLKSAADIVTRQEFAIVCYWYLYATWFGIYCSFWNTWTAPYPTWMKGTPRQYAAVFADLKVPAVIHQTVMAVLTPMKASGQIFYPVPGNLSYPVNYDDEGNPVQWTQNELVNRVFCDRNSARYQVNFGNAYQNIVNGEDRAEGNLAGVQMQGFPGYDDPPDDDYQDDLPNVHMIRSAFDFGYRYCVMPRLMLRMTNFLETIGLADKEITSYIVSRDVPAPQDLVYTSFGIGEAVRPLPPGYVTRRCVLRAQSEVNLKEELNTWSLALFTTRFTDDQLQRLNPGEQQRCFVLAHPNMYLRATSTNERWYHYIPEMVRLNLLVATIALTD